MDFQAIARAGRESPDAVAATVYTSLSDAIDAVGVASVADATTIADDDIAAIAAGDRPGLTLREAGEVFAVAGRVPDAETFRDEVRDAVVLWMSDAVIDVTTLADRLQGCEPAELEARIEGDKSLTVTAFGDLVAGIKANE